MFSHEICSDDHRNADSIRRRFAMNIRLISAALICCSCASAPAFAGATLDKIKARGELVCGVNTSAPGFSSANSQGQVGRA